MTGLFPFLDMERALIDPYPLWNMGLPVFSRVPPGLPFFVSPRKKTHQVLRLPDRGIIHILVNGLVADMTARMVEGEPTSDQLGRPAQFELRLDILLNPAVF